MGDRPLDWQSFWDVATPRHAAQMLIEHYGAAAHQAAAHCARVALADERWEDHDFWNAALEELQGTAQDPPDFPAAVAEANDSSGYP
jgi:hypothetical protein